MTEISPPLSLSRAADAEALLDLYRRAEDYALLESGMLPDTATVDGFFDDCPPGCDPAASLKIGCRDTDRRIVGIADMGFGYPERTDAYIGLLLLDPLARGAGLGVQMLRYLEDAARQRGARRIFAAVLDANRRARVFWEREGFVLEKSFEPRAFGSRMHEVHRLVKRI